MFGYEALVLTRTTLTICSQDETRIDETIKVKPLGKPLGTIENIDEHGEHLQYIFIYTHMYLYIYIGASIWSQRLIFRKIEAVL